MNEKKVRLRVPCPPGPPIPLTPQTDLGVEKLKALQQRLRTALVTRDLLAQRVVELQDELNAYRRLADELAADLERVYDMHDQGARVLAAEAERDRDD
jgi:hypothetical protein